MIHQVNALLYSKGSGLVGSKDINYFDQQLIQDTVLSSGSNLVFTFCVAVLRFGNYVSSNNTESAMVLSTTTATCLNTYALM